MTPTWRGWGRAVWARPRPRGCSTSASPARSIRIASRSRPTSSKAGGQWAVSVLEYKGKERELTDIIKTAYTTFKASIGQGFGVSERPNYTASHSHNLDLVIELAPGLIPPR